MRLRFGTGPKTPQFPSTVLPTGQHDQRPPTLHSPTDSRRGCGMLPEYSSLFRHGAGPEYGPRWANTVAPANTPEARIRVKAICRFIARSKARAGYSASVFLLGECSISPSPALQAGHHFSCYDHRTYHALPTPACNSFLDKPSDSRYCGENRQILYPGRVHESATHGAGVSEHRWRKIWRIR